MQRPIIIAAFVLALSFIQQEQTSFAKLSTLTGGTWVMKTPRGTVCERWKKANNSMLQNQAFRTAGADTTWMEHVELTISNNTINYTSTVPDENDGKPVVFKMISAVNDQFVFANPAHDFPQRIIYHIVSTDSLHAWIEGTFNGKESRKDFYYNRK